MVKQIFLFYGDEAFLIEEKVKELKKKIPDPSLNVEQIEAESGDLARIAAALQTQPLLLGEKLIIVKDLDLTSEAADYLAPCLQSLMPNTKVVFWSPGVDKRSRFYKLLDKIGEVCEFKSFTEWESAAAVSWIIKQVKSHGKAISHDAAAALREICGSSLQKLYSEIDKLVTYLGARPEITKDDVFTLASPGDISVFELSDAVLNRDLPRALASFSVLSANKTDYFSLIGLLASNFRTMLQGQGAGANSYFVRKCLEKAKYFKPDELRRSLELLLETDLKLKTGESSQAAMEILLTELCHGR